MNIPWQSSKIAELQSTSTENLRIIMSRVEQLYSVRDIGRSLIKFVWTLNLTLSLHRVNLFVSINEISGFCCYPDLFDMNL